MAPVRLDSDPGAAGKRTGPPFRLGGAARPRVAVIEATLMTHHGQTERDEAGALRASLPA